MASTLPSFPSSLFLPYNPFLSYLSPPIRLSLQTFFIHIITLHLVFPRPPFFKVRSESTGFSPFRLYSTFSHANSFFLFIQYDELCNYQR